MLLSRYTRESFAYKTLNNALRTDDIDTLILFRFFIHDIYEQLSKLQSEQLSMPYRVYRAQRLSHDEFAILMSLEGQVVSMNSFLSTTRDKSHALFLAESAAENTEGLLPILFEIDVDPTLPNTKPFADISEKSHFPEEQEILLMLGSLFRILSVRPIDKNGICIIHMNLCSDDQNELKELLSFMRREVGEQRTLFTLGALLAKAGKWKAAERCYCRYLQALPTNSHDRISQCYHELALISKDQGDLSRSIDLLEKVLAVQKQIYPSNHVNIGNTLNSLGAVLEDSNDLNRSLLTYQQALNIFKSAYGDMHPLVVSSTINEGNIYYRTSRYLNALQCYEEALAIGTEVLPENHIMLASCHMNIGECYRSLRQYDMALEYFERSLQMKQKSLPTYHPDIADTYYNMGCTYFGINKHAKALDLWRKALSIYRMTLPSGHPMVIRVTAAINKAEKSIQN